MGDRLGPKLADWWREAAAALTLLERPFAADRIAPVRAVALIRDAIAALAGDTAWAGPAGREAAALFEQVEDALPHGAERLAPAGVAGLLRALFDEVAVRPPQGGHPRLAILGLVEARLQSADLVVVAGLNEGMWPALPAPDPWLAPRIRAELGLPGLERRIGIAAHDFARALGAPKVLLTRARRDASAPTVASRFLLRLQAMAGRDLAADTALPRLGRMIDAPAAAPAPAPRPQPAPPIGERPRRISVTEVDGLKADPFAFYAKRMLGLGALDAVDADASPAWRGTAVHAVLEAWARDDDCDPAKLVPRAEAMLGHPGTHPLTRALWSPRLVSALGWIAETTAERRAEGHRVLAAEVKGGIAFAGVELVGKFDRIDRRPDGTLGIIDYKTGQPPSTRAVGAGYALQLGLIGLIAERDGFAGIAGTCGAFEYWSLVRDGDGFGKVVSPVAGRNAACAPGDFVGLASATLAEAIGRWLTGGDAFKAKLHPEYAPYADYDQLMRRDEWYGRG